MDPERRALPASLPMLGLALLVALLFPALMLRYGGPAAPPTASPAPPTPAATDAPTLAPVATATAIPSRTPTASHTPTHTPTRTPTGTATLSPTPVPTPSETATLLAAETATLEAAETPTPTEAGPPPAANRLGITALSYAGRDEYVEITNLGPEAQDLTGWTLASVGQKTPYAFPAGYVLAAGAAVRVHSGPDALDAPPAHLKWTGAYVWNNEGDGAYLYNAQGQLVDSRSY